MINLAKALKIKNRLVGQLRLLQDTATTHNCVDAAQQISIDIGKTWQDLTGVREKLIILKGKIGAATAPIAGKLAELAEAKNDLVFFDTLPIKEGSQDVMVGYGAGSVMKTITYRNVVNDAEKHRLKAAAQQHIEKLQDEIDEFNAVTRIDFN